MMQVREVATRNPLKLQSAVADGLGRSFTGGGRGANWEAAA